ncbi:serine-rich adhesin for platelets [Hyalella azteca]|uniref:RanBP-type and C3HC4-type zinc finger-containing protein 1 n=1 Tax=Hyalella azteca TaxID=294128 RepID=A0A8B7NRW2_HYAAZ|nr:serine-rich adhesin for platelets [Hyalella azteca]XP_018016444.1 serine-rich adhesin for platelets [Hyalella azteca]
MEEIRIEDLFMKNNFMTEVSSCCRKYDITMSNVAPKSPFGPVPDTKKRRSRLSCHARSCDNESLPKKNGLLKIFKWFQGKVRRSDSLGTCSRTTTDSASTLSGSIPDNIFVPLCKSRSVDNQNTFDQSFERSSEKKHRPSDLPRSNSFKCDKRFSKISTNDSGILRYGEAKTSSEIKKRSAPQPPNLCDEGSGHNISVNTSNETSTNPFYDNINCTSDAKNNLAELGSKDGKEVGRTKRKAPDPPITQSGASQQTFTVHSTLTSTEMFTSSVSLQNTARSVTSTLRSTNSQNSSSCSISSTTSLKSIRIDQNGSIHEFSSTQNLEPNSKFSKPWYKRRTKSKIAKSSSRSDHVIDQVYEFWRPELQFNDGKIAVSTNSPNHCRTSQNEKSIFQKVVESCRTKRKSQISMLAGQLDAEVDTALKIVQPESGSQSVESNPPKTLYLKQEDVSQSSSGADHTYYNTPGKPGEAQKEHNSSIKLSDSTDSQQTNSFIGKSKSSTGYNHEAHGTAIVRSKNIETPRDFAGKPHSSKPSEPTTAQLDELARRKLTNSHAQCPSLIQMANLDAEQFYNLAKDIKTPLALKQLPSTGKQSRVFSGITTRTNSDRIASNAPKNFGLRMNNLFAPDVSVILEASESVTSSSTTAIDDFFSDLNSITTQNMDGIYQDVSIRTETFCENNCKTSYAREIMEELADVQQEIQRINEEEKKEQFYKRMSDNMDNFNANAIKSNVKLSQLIPKNVSDNTSLLSENSIPPPLDINARPEAKLRWQCNVCTLINLSWKITCEACSSRRPTNPTRIREDGSIISPQREVSEDDDSPQFTFSNHTNQETANKILTRSVRSKEVVSERPISEVLKSERQARWELELKKYFGGSDGKATQDPIVIFNKVKEKSEVDTSEQYSQFKRKNESSAADLHSALNEVRKSRVAKFKENLSKFETAGATKIQKNNTKIVETRLEFQDRELSKEIDSFFTQYNNDRNFYKRDNRKRLILSPIGAVKNTINVFDQKPGTALDCQLNKKETRNINKNVGLVKTQTSLFEDKVPCNEIKYSGGKNGRSARLTLKNPDIDISSAISKFDEMAALAEVERLRPKLTKPNVAKPSRKLIIHTKDNVNSSSFNFSRISDANSNTNVENKYKPATTANSGNDLGRDARVSTPAALPSRNINGDEPEILNSPPVEETVMEDLEIHHSLSVLPNSFELIEDSEFQEIEAVHSQRASPINVYFEEACQADCDSDGTEDFADALSVDVINDFNQAETNISGNIMTQTSGGDQDSLNKSQQLQAAEELKRRLTLKKGIDDLKATMSAESSCWSDTNAMKMTYLIKKLESAIERGSSSQATSISRELAEFAASCKIAGSDKDENDTQEANDSKFASMDSSQASNVTYPPQREHDTKQAADHSHPTAPDPHSQPAVNKNRLVTPGFESETEHQSSSMTADVDLHNTVIVRDNKTSFERRKVKSDTVSKLIESEPSELAAGPSSFRVQLFIEDRASHRGPLPIYVSSSMTVGELRSTVYAAFGFPPEVQRWILGRRLADDDQATLAQHKVTREGCPVFLYLVAPPSSYTTDPQEDQESDDMNEREASPKPELSSNQGSPHPRNEVPSRLVSPLAAAKNIYKKNIGSSAITAEDPVIGNELIKREIRELDSKGYLSKIDNQDPKKAVPLVKNNGLQKIVGIEAGTRDSDITGHKKPAGPVSKNVANQTRSKFETETNTTISSTDLPNTTYSESRSPKSAKSDKFEMKRGKCASSDSRKPEPEIPASPAKNGWSCKQCTFVNNEGRPGCEVCGAEKPEVPGASSCNAGQPQVTEHLGTAVSALEKNALVSCNESFECRVCFTVVPRNAGVVLRECLHVFCRECLANAVRYSDTAAVKCLYRDHQYSCDATIQEREVKALVTAAEYEAHLKKSVQQAAVAMQNVFHCKTPDCPGFCVYEDNVNTFLCSVCYKQNCLTCQAQHTGLSCKNYQDLIAQKEDIDSLMTQKFFEDMIAGGHGMQCPQCSVMLMRKWGCDWMRCPMCRTEICWVTRGPRWGPKGTGDVSGGCQCGVNGRKCHPKCTYCH